MSELILPAIGAAVAILGLTIMLYPQGKRKRTEKPKREESDSCIPCGYNYDCVSGTPGKSACLEDREDEGVVNRIAEQWNAPPLPESCYVGGVDDEEGYYDNYYTKEGGAFHHMMEIVREYGENHPDGADDEPQKSLMVCIGCGSPTTEYGEYEDESGQYTFPKCWTCSLPEPVPRPEPRPTSTMWR